MILKGAQRGGAKQLGLHLLKTTENEHVEVHEVRGFMASDLLGALREAEAVSKGTRCKQPFFSVSLNPPETERVRLDTFEQALSAIEDRNGLTGQPRVIVFHEKEGRRHCHAVWSRIDAETMTARPLPFFKTKLREVSKQLYLEHGWRMPRGLVDSKERDPRNFTLEEWQQAKRAGRSAGELKATIQECWASSDSKAAFERALEQRGLYLAQGDRRAHVAVTLEGEPISIPRALGKKSKEVTARLGAADDLSSINQTRQRVAAEILPRVQAHITEARTRATREMQPLEVKRAQLQTQHAEERQRLNARQQARQEDEARARSARQRKGLLGLWDKLTGSHERTRKKNELEALFALQRDREQRFALIQAQLQDRQALQTEIKAARTRHAERLRELHADTVRLKDIQRTGIVEKEPLKAPAPSIPEKATQPAPPVRPKDAFERLETLRAKTAAPFAQTPVPAKTVQPRSPVSAQERLQRLKDSKSADKGPSHEPDLDG